jgi:hypothetical protein
MKAMDTKLRIPFPTKADSLFPSPRPSSPSDSDFKSDVELVQFIQIAERLHDLDVQEGLPTAHDMDPTSNPLVAAGESKWTNPPQILPNPPSTPDAKSTARNGQANKRWRRRQDAKTNKAFAAIARVSQAVIPDVPLQAPPQPLALVGHGGVNVLVPQPVIQPRHIPQLADQLQRLMFPEAFIDRPAPMDLNPPRPPPMINPGDLPVPMDLNPPVAPPLPRVWDHLVDINGIIPPIDPRIYQPVRQEPFDLNFSYDYHREDSTSWLCCMQVRRYVSCRFIRTRLLIEEADNRYDQFRKAPLEHKRIPITTVELKERDWHVYTTASGLERFHQLVPRGPQITKTLKFYTHLYIQLCAPGNVSLKLATDAMWDRMSTTVFTASNMNMISTYPPEYYLAAHLVAHKRAECSVYSFAGLDFHPPSGNGARSSNMVTDMERSSSQKYSARVLLRSGLACLIILIILGFLYVLLWGVT